MASLYHLNHPSYSWDPSATGLEDHPFFSQGGHYHGPHAHHGPPAPPGPPPPPYWGYGNPPHHGHHGHRGPPPAWEFGGPEHGHRGRHRRHGEWEQRENNDAEPEQNADATSSTEKVPEIQDKEMNSCSDSESDEYRCRKDKRNGKGRHGHDHVHGFGKGGRGGKGGRSRHGHGHGPGHRGGPGAFGGHHHGPHGGPGHHQYGPYGGPGHHHHGPHGGPDFGGPGHFGPPHHAHPMFGYGSPMGKGPKCHGHKGFRGHGHKGKGHKGGRGGMRGPDAGFMRQLGAFFGFPFGPQNETDFQPSVDIFDTPANYILHVSLPGAKKSDLSIDYDAEESVLRLTGIVHRPGMDETLHQALVMEERAHEVGTFQRDIRLGTREAPAPIIFDAIVAKLEDGVLNVTIPKIESELKKVLVEDGDVKEKDATEDAVNRSITPVESEESEEEEEVREYVKIAIQ